MSLRDVTTGFKNNHRKYAQPLSSPIKNPKLDTALYANLVVIEPFNQRENEFGRSPAKNIHNL
jgi:hypothetical protein